MVLQQRKVFPAPLTYIRAGQRCCFRVRTVSALCSSKFIPFVLRMLIPARRGCRHTLAHYWTRPASVDWLRLRPNRTARKLLSASHLSTMSRALDIPDKVEKGRLYIVWASASSWPLNPSGSSQQRVHLSIFDSSYNPPTVAHGQIAAAPLPTSSTALRIAGLSSSQSDAKGVSKDGYTARLLLFSTTNVDKSPSPNDPTIRQRMEMIQKLALDLPTPASSPNALPVAIGLICEATFAGKSSIIHSYFAQQAAPLHPPRLTFLIGTDTLTRFFETRYYPNGTMTAALSQFFDTEGSSIVSARRGRGQEIDEAEEEVLKRDCLRKWIERGAIRLLDQPDESGAEWGEVSSTAVRKAVKADDEAALHRLLLRDIADYVKQQGLYR